MPRRSSSASIAMDADKEQLRRNRQKKRKKFAWLARFLSRGRPSKSSLESKGVLKPEAPSVAPTANRYFGVSLENVYADARLLEGKVPRPVAKCCTAVEGFLDLNGLFRVSGTFSEMATLKSTFERGEVPNFSAVDNKHSISGLLELYFRELPQPITTHALYDDFMSCVEAREDENRMVGMLRTTLDKLPENNRLVLEALLKLLHKVALQKEVNQMDEKNLGIVFGSILLGAEQLQISLAMKQKLQDQSAVVQYLIHHVHELFPGDEPHAVGEVETRGILDTPGREDDYEENEAENGY